MNFSLGVHGRNLWRSYENALHKRPVATQMTTSALLWGTGDFLAQRLVEKASWDGLDKRRLALTAGFGAGFMGPVGHYWYQGLDIVTSRLLKPGTGSFLLAKVVLDTVILGPIYVIAFYAYGSYLIDKTGWHGFKTKIEKDFIPTYCAELAIWPAFQAFNFTKIPVDHQLLAVNCMTLVDASFLSFARSQEDWVGTVMAMIKEQQASRQQAKAEQPKEVTAQPAHKAKSS